jgi:hypothetical protein
VCRNLYIFAVFLFSAFCVCVCLGLLVFIAVGRLDFVFGYSLGSWNLDPYQLIFIMLAHR